MEVTHETNFYTYFSAITVSLLLVCVGIGNTWSSPTLFKLENATNPDNPLGHGLTTDEIGWLGSLNDLGCAMVPLLVGYLTAKTGRKPALQIMGLLWLISFAIVVFAKVIAWFYVGRLFMGFALGGTLTASSTYISEIAHYKERAKLNLILTAATYLGLLIPYIMGPYMSVMAFNLFCAFIPMVFLVVFSAYMSESPHYLIAKYDHERAVAALGKLRCEPSGVILKEWFEIQCYIETNNEASLRDLFGSKVMLKCLFVSVGLFCFKQLVGLGAFMNFTQDIFELADTNMPSDVASAIFSTVMCVVGFGAMFVVPRFRFRTILIWSNIGLITSLSVFGAYFYLKEYYNFDTHKYGWLSIVSLIGVAISRMYGVGVLPPIITSEIVPTKLRPIVLAIGLNADCILCFLISKFYFNLNEVVGMWGSSWIFAGFCLVGLIFDYYLVPETNGVTLSEIQTLLRK